MHKVLFQLCNTGMRLSFITLCKFEIKSPFVVNSRLRLSWTIEFGEND